MTTLQEADALYAEIQGLARRWRHEADNRREIEALSRAAARRYTDLMQAARREAKARARDERHRRSA